MRLVGVGAAATQRDHGVVEQKRQEHLVWCAMEHLAPWMQEEEKEEWDAPPEAAEPDIDAIMADAEAEAAASEKEASTPPPPVASGGGGWEVDKDEDMWAADDAAPGSAAAPRIQADGGEGVEFKATGTNAARRRARKRTGDDSLGSKDGAGGHGAAAAEVQPDGALLFELQKGLGRGLSEALLMVRERGWLQTVDYRGRISDFKHNQRSMVRVALASAHWAGAATPQLETALPSIPYALELWGAAIGRA